MIIHYILVRRDLPFGTTLAQVSHAAADSINEYFTFDWSPMTFLGKRRPHVVVLGVRNEFQLKKWEKKLIKEGVKHVAIEEPDAPWGGALMSIGVLPDEREKLSPLFSKLTTYKELNE